MKATGWRLKAFAALAALFVVLAAAWHWLQDIYPPATVWMREVATTPQSWFILVVLAFILLALTGIRTSTRAHFVGDFENENANSELPIRISEIEQRLKDQNQTFASLAIDSNSAIKKIKDEFNELSKNVVRNNGKIHELSSVLPQTINSIMELLVYSLLYDSVPPKPQLSAIKNITIENLDSEMKLGDAYWRDVTKALSDTKWEYDLRLINQDAQISASQAIRDIPISERPAEIDPLDLMRYAVVQCRCDNCARFIEAAKSESYSVYRSYLSRLREYLLLLKNP